MFIGKYFMFIQDDNNFNNIFVQQRVMNWTTNESNCFWLLVKYIYIYLFGKTTPFQRGQPPPG
jgi:hypothetical protein